MGESQDMALVFGTANQGQWTLKLKKAKCKLAPFFR